MPKPHLPPHAGPYAPAWTSEARRPEPAPSEPRTRAELEAEIARLRGELARLQDYEQIEMVTGSNRSVSMVWCALGLCGAALLFAIAAILYHG